MTTNGYLTPALDRCLHRHRVLCERLGRAPTAREMSEALDGIAKESVIRSVEKLAVRGYDLPLSQDASWSQNAVIPPKAKPPSAAEIELREMRLRIQEADTLLCQSGDPESHAWGEWRKKAAPYLDEIGRT